MSGKPTHLPGLPVRVRVVVTLVLLTAGALLVAGLTASALQSVQVTNSIDDDLRASAAEFRNLAERGTNPETGEAFTNASDLLRVSMGRVVPQRNEGLLGFVDGRLRFRASDAGVAMEEDRALVSALEPLAIKSESTLTEITTDTTTYRVLVIPIEVASGSEESTAAQVMGYDKTAELAGFQRVFRTYTWVAVAAVALVAATAWLIGGRILRPVQTLAQTAGRIGGESTGERLPVKGRDELTVMTTAVNDMLDRLDASAAAQRALLDDVSHELRTPVTVIRGHLEVMGPEDVEETRGIALDELDRMSRLLDDLLTLAVTDQPGFVTLSPVEAGILTDDVFDKARALEDRAWRVEERAEGEVLADSQRLTQAWLQLAANAVKYSDEGSPITLGSRLSDGSLELWVTDRGVGIAPDDLERVFDRFERGMGTRREGAGLGLAIVAAIAEAHGGSAHATSTPGEGSTFVITIPAAAEVEQEES